MLPIHRLPDILVRKIAAGEVIERPASAVKELMENAVDAGATRIAVHIEDAGRALIRVTDDGCGIDPDQLTLAVAPHATSKLAHEDDLYRIGSLGFRGEALASIGAVSRMRILTMPHGPTEGGEVLVEAEKIKTAKAAGCRPGTTVEVRDLFFNVPARRKFLKHTATEVGHVTTQFSRIALAHPQIAFELANNGRNVRRLCSCASRRERIVALQGPELADTLIEFRSDEGGIAVEGYAARPADARSNANWQFTFLNGRFIRDKFIQHAVKEAYRGLIDPRRFPIVFLYLDIDPANVDVNVHPTKIEVRWQDGNAVHGRVLAALREALRAADLTPELHAQPDYANAARSNAAPASADQDQLRRTIADELRRATPVQSYAAPESRSHWPTDRTPAPAMQVSLHPAGAADPWRSLYAPIPVQERNEPTDVPDLTHIPAEKLLRDGGVIQLHNTYLVCETDDGMLIIDQHALHERILYEQFKQRIAGGKLEGQRLLLPETVTVTAAQLALLERHADLLDKLGLEVSPFGTDSLAVHSLPALLKDTDAAPFVRDLIDLLESRNGQVEPEVVIHAILDMMACKAAVKAGDPLTRGEIENLVRQKDLVEKSSNCPHGRPTTLRLTVKDLERQFKRT